MEIKPDAYYKYLGYPKDNLKSAFTLPIAGSHAWQKVSPMKVGRATHACLATKFGVSLKNFLLTKVVEGLGIIP